MPRVSPLVLFLFVLCGSFHGFCQNKEQQNWYFGYFAGLSFTTSPPTVLTDGKVVQVNSSATMSDRDGNLLFYCDGNYRIYNRNHEIMANGDGIEAYDGNFAQQVVIVRHPGAEPLYYIFYISEPQYPVHLHRLKYSIVNMTDGIGVVESKNTVLETQNLTVKLTAIEKRGSSFWIIAQGDTSEKYYCFRGTKDGIDPTPVIIETSLTNVGNYDYGSIKFAPGGKVVAATTTFSNRLSLFKFDFATGNLSDPIYISLEEAAGLEFSPDGRFLYVTTLPQCEQTELYQYDISSYKKSDIESSRKLIGTGYAIGMLQRGPDNRIYVGQRNPANCNFHSYMGVINNPNSSGSACGFVLNAINLGTKSTWQGLPQFPEIITCPSLVSLPKEAIVCNKSEYVLDISASKAKVVWEDGSTNPVRAIKNSGTYWAESSLEGCVERDTVEVNFINFVHPQLRDTLVCSASEYVINLASLNVEYRWPDGSTGPTFKVKQNGTVAIDITTPECSARVSVQVTIDDSKVEFAADTVYQFTKPVKLSPGPVDSIVWQDNSTNESYNATEPGQYSFTAWLNGCIHRDTIIVVRRDLFIPNIITPNNDPLNEFFVLPFARDNEQWEVRIYNRYGKELFYDPDYKNNWNLGTAQICYYRIRNREYGVDVKGTLHVIN